MTHAPKTVSSKGAVRSKASSGRKTRLLLAALVVVASLGAVRWWQVSQYRLWLDTASIDELAAKAPLKIDDVELFSRLGAKAREAEQWPRAAKAFQHAAELAPDRADIWVGWARSVYEIAGFKAANAILTSYIERHPRESRAYVERAALGRLARRGDVAWDDADRATQMDPRNGNAWALRGDLCMDKGIPGEGEESYLKALALLPGSPWPHVGLYQAYVTQKKFPEALTEARYMADHFPSVPEGKLYLGEVLTEMAGSPEDFENARKALLEAEKNLNVLRHQDKFALFVLRGRTYFKQARWSEALPHLKRAQTLVPDNPDMLFLLGRTYRALGDTARAEDTMRQHRDSYAKTEAVRQLMARVNEKPNDPQARLNLARWYVKNNVRSNAVSQYEEMIDLGIDVETAKRELAAVEAGSAVP